MLLLVIPLSPAATAVTAADDEGNALAPGVIDLRVRFVVRIVPCTVISYFYLF